MRDTFAWLDENDVKYAFIDLKKEPLSDEKLADFVEKVGLDVILNRRGMKWRTLGLKDKNLDDQELFDQLLEHQTMIKRPVLERDEAILVGYDEDAFESFID